MGLPIINLSLLPVFPANVVGSGPIVITKAGLTYTFDWDIATFSENPAPDTTQTLLLGYSPSTGAAELYPLAGIQSGFEITASQIIDSTATGRAVLTGDAVAGRTALGLGPIATLNVGAGLAAGGGDLSLGNTAVTPGIYVRATVTVDQQGRITAAASNSNSADVPRSYLAGLALSNNVTDATNDIDIAAGICRSAANANDLTLPAANVKQIDVAFSEYVSIGTASGGRASADNLTGAKWFNVFLIGGAGKNDQGFFATSASPTLPSGFTYSRRIGSVYWTGSAIKSFTQTGDTVHWTSPPLDVNVSNLAGTTTAYTLTTPTGFKCLAILNIAVGDSTGAIRVYIHSPDNADEAASATAAPLSTSWVVVTTATSTGPAQIMTGTASNIRAVSNDTATTLAIATLGYIDRRGRDD